MAFFLCGARGWVVFFCGFVCCLCAGIRGLGLRWHPRVGVGTSRVAPVRGSTYFSLPRQRKVGKRKPLNTASTCSCLRAPNRSYTSHGVALLTARCQRSEGAPHPLHTPASQHVLQDSPPPPRWQTVCRPVEPHTPHFGPIAHAFHPVRAPGYTTRQPTHSLPPGRHIPFADACPSTSIRSG